MRKNKNNKLMEVNRHHTLSTLLSVMVAVTILSACGDFRDEPTPAPEPQPVPQPAPHPQPGPKPQLHSETEEQRNKRLCDAERKWALESGLIDLNQFRLYENRNFAPVFNTPGVRQSGVDGWTKCQVALEINGFIPQRNTSTPTVVTNPPVSPSDRRSEQPAETTAELPTATPPHTENHSISEEEEVNRMCEEERDYVLKARIIDANLFRMFQRRNFAPVYETPGERQSGIESWAPCMTALRINGFIWY